MSHISPIDFDILSECRFTAENVITRPAVWSSGSTAHLYSVSSQFVLLWGGWTQEGSGLAHGNIF